VQPLVRLRLRLTAWYAGVVLSLLALMSAGLYVAVRRQTSADLDRSLEAATAAVIQAARIREMEHARAHGVLADALDELHIPDRSLYLFDSAGAPIKPDSAAPWIVAAARVAARAGRADGDFETPDDRDVRLHAERFTGARGSPAVALVVANEPELEDQYAPWVRVFALVALAALVLVTGGGYLLIRAATAPVEQSLVQMRRFMADAAHELRTPVTLLRTRAELAAGQDREPARDRETFDTIEREAMRLGEIVGELLTLARADAGERLPAREALYLDDAVAGAVEAARALARRNAVALEVDRFEEAKIRGDPALVRQLLLIVLDNALKFTPAGGRVTLGVSVADGRAAVVVTDTGVGIAADDLPHVFERFYRGTAGTQVAEGAGLGLAIARWIAEVHGATIDLVSQPRAGTRVTIRFPLVP